MPKYRVGVADKDTGKETTIIVDADSPQAAEFEAQRVGWLVSTVSLKSQPKRTPWVIAGLVVGGVCTLCVVLGIASTLIRKRLPAIPSEPGVFVKDYN